ncbi:hypothetical protein WQ57_01605 [Mesobacillus campisalis]|uniref:Helix-hairpin-helix domain-containing protein n=1 Tax=Mesobacillus campisalis TaxID=1408103 RepID=A0A0M2T1Z0_9BACI|nr:helix-hairpin-helix domain-containing protein [Mesobacillus campisalis]KKK39991.1 hypothetical protein WQ57_01605 [Mesobacillus campisalis]
MAKSITSKGKTWEVLNSLWVLWAVATFGFFNYISFFYIAYRVKQKKWTVIGCLYAIPFILLMVISEVVPTDHWLYNTVFAAYLIGWIASIFHVFRVRPEYLLRLEAYKSVEHQGIEKMRKNIASEYGVGGGESTKQVPVVNRDEEQKISPAVQPIIPVDLNSASEKEISEIPHIGVILAKKIVSIRESTGGFATIEQFSDQLNLKPHIIEKIRPYIKVTPMKAETSEQSGRIVDF